MSVKDRLSDSKALKTPQKRCGTRATNPKLVKMICQNCKIKVDIMETAYCRCGHCNCKMDKYKKWMDK